MEIPIELFLGGIAVSIAIGIFGFIRNPQVPAMLCFGGAFILLLSVSTTSILMDSFLADGQDDLVSYDVDTVTSGSRVGAGGVPAPLVKGEYASSSSSQLVGDVIDCMDIRLQKIGAPVDTTIQFGVFSGVTNGALIQEFGTRSSALLPASSTTIVWTFCLPIGTTYTIQTGDLIGMKFLNGDAVGNNLNIMRDTTNPFDGTITFLRQCDTTIPSCTTTDTASDVTMKLYLRGSDVEITQNPYEFTELPKTFFALIGGTMILLGALMVIKE